MNFVKKYLSYLRVINQKKYESAYNGTLEINWLNGKKILDTTNTNYSYGNLGEVLKKGMQKVTTPFKEASNEILILGLGGGDAVKQLRNDFKSKATITALEIDPVVIEIAVNEFDILSFSNVNIVNQDAELFLKYSTNTYHLIIVDLFFDATIPDFVFQQSFIQNINNCLHKNGSVIFNTFILDDLHNIRNQKLIHLLKTYFTIQSFKNLYGHNHLIIAQKII